MGRIKNDFVYAMMVYCIEAFPSHPFKVNDDVDMVELIQEQESVRWVYGGAVNYKHNAAAS